MNLPPAGEEDGEDTSGAFHRLRRVVERLRGPDGCPWDRKQSVASVRRYLLVEAYEALDALEATPEEAREELGDVLFQVAFLARLFEEQGAFDLAELASRAAAKMVARHPHVFAGEAVRDAEEVAGRWAELKARARGEEPGERSLLDGVPRALPGLERALELTERAARVGFDWADAGSVLTKVDEERAELGVAIAGSDPAAAGEEIGDLLFVIANLARKLGLNPERCLHQTNSKFIRRFRFIEDQLRTRGLAPAAAGPEAMNALWDEAKARGL